MMARRFRPLPSPWPGARGPNRLHGAPGGGPGPGSDPGTGPSTGPRVDPGGARVNLLYLPPALLVLTTLTAGPVALALGLAGAGLWVFGAYLTREGLRAEAAWHARRRARRPALPRKALAALGLGAGTALAALAHGGSGLGAGLYAIIAAALHLAAFGPDPWRDKGLTGDAFQQDRALRAVDEADRELGRMEACLRPLRDPELRAAAAAFIDSARALCRRVEADPRDLTAARKYLSVYLTGARSAAERYADLVGRGPDPQARAGFLTLLDDLHRNFEARTDSLLDNDRADLEIEVEVLRDRLAREGLNRE